MPMHSAIRHVSFPYLPVVWCSCCPRVAHKLCRMIVLFSRAEFEPFSLAGPADLSHKGVHFHSSFRAAHAEGPLWGQGGQQRACPRGRSYGEAAPRLWRRNYRGYCRGEGCARHHEEGDLGRIWRRRDRAKEGGACHQSPWCAPTSLLLDLLRVINSCTLHRSLCSLFISVHLKSISARGEPGGSSCCMQQDKIVLHYFNMLEAA